MTVQQAQAEINNCEQEIIRAHSSLCSAARMVGSSAKKCADSGKTKKTLSPLTIIGIFFLVIVTITTYLDISGIGEYFMMLAFYSALPLIIVGIVRTRNKKRSARWVAGKVEDAQNILNSTIDRNSEI